MTSQRTIVIIIKRLYRVILRIQTIEKRIIKRGGTETPLFEPNLKSTVRPLLAQAQNFSSSERPIIVNRSYIRRRTDDEKAKASNCFTQLWTVNKCSAPLMT